MARNGRTQNRKKAKIGRNSNKKTARREGKSKSQKNSKILGKPSKSRRGIKERKHQMQIRKYKMDINLEIKVNRDQPCLTRSTHVASFSLSETHRWHSFSSREPKEHQKQLVR